LISTHQKRRIIFAQGDTADAVMYIRKGKVKITVVSKQGKEAVVAILGPDEFFGEGCLIGQPKRLATATAMTECVTMRVEKTEILRVLRDEPAFSMVAVCILEWAVVKLRAAQLGQNPRAREFRRKQQLRAGSNHVRASSRASRRIDRILRLRHTVGAGLSNSHPGPNSEQSRTALLLH
jgi:CRP-like cAMP-binding protein